MLFVGAVVQRFAGLRMKFLPCPLSDGTIELDIGSIELGLARLQISIEALDQSGHLVVIKVTVVVIEIIEVWSLLVLGLIVTALHAPNVSPVRRRRMIGAE